ncbi:MAG TPA: maleylpyruvate isomerase N-terminal domain-containing protein [Nocardioidaceae bacterium]|nr:maleylpyruvate isomerase N-terminal domain-containing protein [Nocardioidaceae bacterium]
MAEKSLARADTKARTPVLGRQSAMRLAAQEYDRVVTLLEELTSAQWALATTCPGWDVRAMSGHVLGMAQMVASVPELARQQMASQKTAKRSGDASIDALTALQVAKNASLTTEEVVQQMRTVGPRAVRGRRRIPAVVRNRKMPEAQDVGGEPDWLDLRLPVRRHLDA